jgi:hypothetical protein
MNVDHGHGDVSSQSISEAGNGEWIVPAVSYVAPDRRFCAFCGRPIARRFWQRAIEDRKRIFCDPTHADLYTTYPTSFDELDL